MKQIVNVWKHKEGQEIVMSQMNVLVVAKQLQIKQILHAIVVMTLLLGQNHFWKDPSLRHLQKYHVEKLKKQIEREWGSTIDKAVDLTIKTVAKQWQGALSKSSANKEFYTELEKIFKTAKEQ